MAQAKTTKTVDHDEIREWVEERGGGPAVLGSSRGAEGGGVLRVDFGLDDEQLQEISWEEFFRIFDENDLAFLYQEETAEGEPSYFCKFVARSGEGGAEEGVDTFEEEM